MKALTIQQPWAWAVAIGAKRIENRTQQWRYRGPLAIHAGQRISERGMADDRIWRALSHFQRDHGGAPVSLPGQLVYGAILGTVELVDCHPDAGCCKPWGESAYVEHGGRERRRITHLVLENPRLLAEPIPCSGLLGLWTPPADVQAEIERQETGQ
ncbi:hypothetical protein B1R94_02165 [Mycolicibacterium litorale]|nr:hypothetical protein B1R94_02165 [Mycolicibacterium litorale]